MKSQKNYAILRSFFILALIAFAAMRVQAQFDADKPSATYSNQYYQNFTGGSAAWDGTTFYNQWSMMHPNSFSAADMVNGYLEFGTGDSWIYRRILYSNVEYKSPYIFETKIGNWGSGASERGGMVLRFKNQLMIDDLQEPGTAQTLPILSGAAHINRTGIALYPRGSAQFNIQFSGVVNATTPGATEVFAFGVTRDEIFETTSTFDLRTGLYSVIAEDYGDKIFVYFKDAGDGIKRPLAKIVLGGLTNGVYTTAEVFGPNMVSKGVTTNKYIPATGRIAIAQRVRMIQLYEAKVQYTAMDADKPVVTYNQTYNQTFSGSWDGTTFNNQWTAIGAFAASDIANGYLLFNWTDKRIIYSNSEYSSPYLFEAKIGNWGVDGAHRGGMVIRYQPTLTPEELQENGAGGLQFNRAGIAFFPRDIDNFIVQVSEVDNGTATVVQTFDLPRPLDMGNLMMEAYSIRIEDFDDQIFVYLNYNGAVRPFCKITLGGWNGTYYTSGEIFNSGLTSIGTFTNKRVPKSGRIAVAQRASNIHLYNAKVQYVDNTTATREVKGGFSLYSKDARIIANLQDASSATMNVYDVNGRLVYSNAHNSGSQLVTSKQFAKGLYLVKIRTSNDEFTGKLVVE